MFYFSVTAAVARIVKYRDLYLQLQSARQEGESDVEWGAREQMARLSLAVQRDMEVVNTGYVTLIDPPMLGGTRQQARVANLAIDMATANSYYVSQQDLILEFEKAIGEYRRLTRGAFLNLFNPFWWLRAGISLLASLPFYLIGIAGFNQETIESSVGGRASKLLIELAMVAAAIITVYDFLR